MEEDILTLTDSPTHQLECLTVVDEIIDNMDDRGILELFHGAEGDVDSILYNLMKDTYAVLYTGKMKIDFAPKYIDHVSSSLEETLRCKNLTYFITSVLPDFQLSWHHLEWGDLVQHYNKLCIEAARDHGKCEAVGTEVLMFDGRIKKVEDVRVGEYLMGVDSTPRLVTATYRGKDKHMYRIDQSKGDSYTVNSRHICTLIQVERKGGCLENRKKTIVDVDIPTLLTYSKNYIRERLRGFKVAWEMPYKRVLIDPYFLGLWLGDGCKDGVAICKPYKEIVDYCDDYARRLGIFCDHEGWNDNLQCYSNHIFYKEIRDNGSRNIKDCKLTKWFKTYRLFSNKHIPDVYLYNSREVRMQLLAGLLDTDGDLWQNGYHWGSIYKELAEQVRYLANSLGFRTKFGGGKKFNKQLGRDYTYWRVSISGKIDEIPVRLPHKKIKYNWGTKQSNKDWGTIDGITPSVVSSIEITDVGPGEYVGITTDGDHRFLLADGTVTHNSYYFSNAYPAWQLYRYSRPQGMQRTKRPTKSNSNRGYLFSFSLQQSVDLMEILKNTIEGNEILKERLYPDTKNSGAWASTNIVCKNGARLTCKGFGSSVRGAHPYWIVVDDGLKDNVIYSQLQRQKSIDYFHSVIMNMLVPGGQITVVGCVSPNTIVMSQKRGFVRMRNIKQNYIEDKKKVVRHCEGFLDRDGFVNTSHYFYNGYGRMKRITLQGGFELECSLIHPLWKMGENGVPNWAKSSELKIGDWIGIKPSDIDKFGSPIDLSSFICSCKLKKNRNYNEVNLKLPKYLNEDLAYFIGLWIAEGTIYKNGSGIELASGDREIADFLFSLKKYNINFRGSGIEDGSYQYVVTNRRLHSFMIWLGFHCPCYCNIKNIPDRLLSAPKNILKQIISGIFDGDGHVDVSDGGLSVVLSSTSPMLIKTMQSILLMGWGIVSVYSFTTADEINSKLKNDCHVNFDQYRLSIHSDYAVKFLKEIGFRLSRKQNKFDFNKTFKINSSHYHNIPLQGSLFAKAEKRRLDNKIHYRGAKGYDKDIEYAYQIKKKKTSTKHYLKRVCEFFYNLTGYEEYKQIIDTCDSGIIWRQIKSIDDIDGSSCDFVIPSTHSFITNGIVSHNTPFHASDLYGDLKSKSISATGRKNGWFVIEYPAIFPNGQVLWPQRWSFLDLMDKKTTQGNIIFSRENLCRPITNESSIFPLKVLERSLVRMENYCLVNNRDDFPIKFNKVVVGCDFAISANVGSDYTVFTVWGVDDETGERWLLHFYRDKGKTFREQMQVLKGINIRFRPDTMVLEQNVFQQIFVEESSKEGLPVVGHSTGIEKYDLKSGWPGLAIDFERGKIHIPIGDKHSQNVKDLIFSDLGSVAFTDKGLESVGEHDDISSSFWLAKLAANLITTGFKFTFLD